jgi:hypothetical protein
VDIMPIKPQHWNPDNKEGVVETRDETLKHVLRDKHLLYSLKRRTKWIFTSTRSLLITLSSVSSFMESDISVVLDIPDSQFDYEVGFSSFAPNPTNIAVDLLAACRKLTSLKIVLSDRLLDLDVIVRACPCLKIVAIVEHLDINDYVHFKGTLAALSHLESVNIILDADNHGLDTFFPVSSTSTLNHFALISNWADYVPYTPTCIDTAILDKFVNLTSIHISPITKEMCDFITHTKISFRDFRTSKCSDENGSLNLPELVNMLCAQSLRKLKQFRLAFNDSYQVEWRQCYPPILRTIISNLTSLEKLVLGMDVHASWSPEISQMPHLQELKWYIWCDNEHHFPSERLSRVDAEKGSEAVRNAFSNLEKRTVTFELCYDVSFKEILYS